MADDGLLEHVADIVTAHVSKNAVSVADLPTLIQTVHASLAGLSLAAEPVEEPREPAVSIRASVKPDRLICLDCGAKFKLLKRHLRLDHNLTPAEYRARWKLPVSYPIVAADYAAKRAELAKKIGLGRKPAATIKANASAKSTAATKAAAKTKPTSASKPRKKLSVAFEPDVAPTPITE